MQMGKRSHLQVCHIVRDTWGTMVESDLEFDLQKVIHAYSGIAIRGLAMVSPHALVSLIREIEAFYETGGLFPELFCKS